VSGDLTKYSLRGSPITIILICISSFGHISQKKCLYSV
jgi:hypothetical protein